MPLCHTPGVTDRAEFEALSVWTPASRPLRYVWVAVFVDSESAVPMFCTTSRAAVSAMACACRLP